MSWFSCVEDGLVPEQGCEPWASALDDGNAIMGPKSSDISDCEVMMMVGLPASGKTTWAEKWAEEYPEKRFVLLGRNLILDEMKVPGLFCKHGYVNNSITDSFQSFINQTNVFKNACTHKLRPFSNFCKVVSWCHSS